MSNPLLHISQVSKTFNSHSMNRSSKFLAVDNVSFSIQKGDSVALLVLLDLVNPR
jgi:ABC-type oligopeptide transport system ATPase subunit